MNEFYLTAITVAVAVGTALIVWDSRREHLRIVRFQERHANLVNNDNEFYEEYEFFMKAFKEEVLKPKAAKTGPPRTARLMVRWMMYYKDQEPLLGDLNERYEDVRAEDGKRAANIFYFSQVIMSIFAQVKRVSFFVLIGAWIKRIIS